MQYANPTIKWDEYLKLIIMKYLILILTFTLCYSLHAQEKVLKSADRIEINSFLRVYNLKGKKIAKGKLISTDKSSLTLKRNKNLTTISLDNIGSIKTKRSGGHNLLLGASIGTGVAIILIIDSGTEPRNYDALTAIGTSIFTVLGTGIGAATINKNRRTYQINGDTIKWEAFRSHIIND